MNEKDQNIINEINFTKRCIIMAVLSKEKNLVLINSFYKIPIVKLYTADSSYNHFIYSKIKGAFLILMSKEKDIKNRKYYFRIYSLKDYSILFNMEVKKEYMQYITQYREDFYFMELRQSFLGFKFLSKESASIFFLLLNEDPKKEIIQQNEGSMNIKSKEISKNLNKISDYIKSELKYKFENYGNKNNNNNNIKGFYSKYNRPQKKENTESLIINGIKGDYLDLSIIPEISILINNLEIDDTDSSCYLFTEKKLDLKKCQEIVKSYETNSDAPLTIIDKDCHTIANTDLYAEIMTKNIINNIQTQKRLEIFQKEHKKRYNQTVSSNRKISRKTTKARTVKTNQQRILSFSNYYQDNNSDKRTSSYVNNSNTSPKINSESKSVEKENSGKFAKERRQINSIAKTEVFVEMDDEDDEENNKKNLKGKKGVEVIEEKPEDEEKDYNKIIQGIKELKSKKK